MQRTALLLSFAFAGACASQHASPAASPVADHAGGGSTPRVDMLRLEGAPAPVSIAGSTEPSVARTGDGRVRAAFYLEDDAYVLVGRVSPNGVVRVMVPANPGDSNFYHQNHLYKSHDAFTNFGSEFQERFDQRYDPRQASLNPVQCCTDAGVFIIASTRPLRFDAVSANGRWRDFPLLDSDNSDVAKALDEFVTRVAGNDRATYTVRYASASDGLQWNLKTWDAQHADLRGR